MKYVDPDGRVPVKSGPVRGILTHIEIQNYLTSNYGGSSQFYLKSKNPGSKGSFFVDYSRDSDASSITTELYEIKPDTYIKSQRGDKQLQRYIDRAGDGFVKGTEILNEINGTVISTNILSDNPTDFSGTITLYTDIENHPGMIFYSLDDGKTMQEKAKETITKIVTSVTSVILSIMGVPSGVLEPIPAPTLP